MFIFAKEPGINDIYIYTKDMNYLTKKERLHCYKVALQTLRYRKANDQLKGASACICPILVIQATMLLNLKGTKITINQCANRLLMIFPEYRKFKPHNLSKGEPWFPLWDYNARINILKQLIKELL